MSFGLEGGSVDISEDVINPLAVVAVPISIMIISAMLVFAIVGIIRLRIMPGSVGLPTPLNIGGLISVTIALVSVGFLGLFGGFKRIIG